MITFVVRRVAPLAVLALTVGLLLRNPSALLSDNDTYFHLRFGSEYLSGSWSIWAPGTPSAFSTAEWTPTQWLPQIAMAWAEDVGGLAAVSWLVGVTVVLLVAVLFVLARRHADPLAASFATAVAMVAMHPSLSARPQVVSYLLMAVVVHQWLRTTERGRPPWLVIPVTWLWAMCHGMWPLGILVGVVVIVGLALDRVVDRRMWWRHALVVVLSAVAAAATPLGPSVYRGVGAVTSRTELIGEWGPPEFTHPYGLAVLALGSIALLHMLRRSNAWLEILLVGLALGLGIYSIRTVPIAAVILLPFAARGIQSLVGDPTPRPRWEAPVLGGLVAVGLAALTISALAVPTHAREVPDWLDDRVAALEEGTPVINETGWDGYLMWRHPHVDPMAHAYFQIYRDEEFEAVLDVLLLRPELDRRLRDSGVAHALLPPDNPLIHVLVRDGWSRQETSEDLVWLLAPGAGH